MPLPPNSELPSNHPANLLRAMLQSGWLQSAAPPKSTYGEFL
jgi:hypothetical protein